MPNLLLQLSTLTDPSGWVRIGEKLPSIFAGLVGTFLVFVVGRWLLRQILRRVFRPLIERERAVRPQRAARLMTLETVARSVAMYALYFIVLGMLLASVGLNPASLLATAGVAGVAIGFGAQKLVRDVVTGFLLLLEDQFAVGDLVSIGGNIGVVEETGMRITKLRDETGRLIILSNGDIVQVINYTKGQFRVAVDVAVAPETEAETMAEAVREAEERLTDGSLPLQPQLRGVVGMSAASVTYRVEAEAPPVNRQEAEAMLRAALRAALLERGVKLA